MRLPGAMSCPIELPSLSCPPAMHDAYLVTNATAFLQDTQQVIRVVMLAEDQPLVKVDTDQNALLNVYPNHS